LFGRNPKLAESEEVELPYGGEILVSHATDLVPGEIQLTGIFPANTFIIMRYKINGAPFEVSQNVFLATESTAEEAALAFATQFGYPGDNGTFSATPFPDGRIEFLMIIPGEFLDIDALEITVF